MAMMINPGRFGVSVVERNPTQMDFTRQAVVSSFDPAPAAFTWLDEEFVSDTGQFSLGVFGSDTVSAFAVSSGKGTITHSGSGFKSRFARTGADIAVPQVFASVEVSSVSGVSASGGWFVAGVGIAKDSNNRFTAMWDQIDNSVEIRSTIAGSDQTHGKITSIGLTPPFKIGLAMSGTGLSLWLDTGSGWTYKSRVNILSARSFNPLTTSLSGWKPYFASWTSGVGVVNFDSLTMGRFGTVALRDPSIIRNEDGSPVDFSGKVRFLATASDPNGGLGSSYAGVFELDPSDWSVTQTGILLISRDSGLFTDHAGTIVRQNDLTWRVMLSTWGNRNVANGDLRIIQTTTASDPTSGVVTLSSFTDVTPSSLPATTTKGWYDPSLLRIAGEWWLGYTIVDPKSFAGQNFYQALEKTTDFVTWTAIGTDPSRTNTEGSGLVNVNGNVWLTAGSVVGGVAKQRIYNSTLTFTADNLSASPSLPVGNLNPAWPSIFPKEDQFVMLTFDGTLFGGASTSMGQLWVYTSPRYL